MVFMIMTVAIIQSVGHGLASALNPGYTQVGPTPDRGMYLQVMPDVHQVYLTYQQGHIYVALGHV